MQICDLLREKGPTAIKHRFETQLNAFLFECYVTSLHLQVKRISRKECKKRRKNAFNLPHILENNVELQEIFTSEQRSLSVFVINSE